MNIVIGGLMAGVVLLVWGYRHFKKKEKERNGGLQAAAEKMNFSYEEKGSLHEGLQHFHIFSQGRSKKSSNIMKGRATDLEITIFDYRYTTGGGNSSTTHHFTIVLFDSPNERIPGFSLRPEHVFHKIGQVLGFQDIDFKTHPEFSKKYLLRGDHEDRIREVFAPHVLDHFETNPGTCVEASGGQLIFYPTRKRVKPEELEGLLQDAVRTYALFTT